MSITVLLADDHPTFRYGVRATLAGIPDIEVVAEATSGEEAVRVAAQGGVAVVLMDLEMPGMGGVEATRALTRSAPDVAVLILTMFDSNEALFAAMRAGARGYLVKGAETDQIVRAIRAVADGEVVFGAGIAARALSHFADAKATRSTRPFPELTDREVDVLRLIAEGHTNAQIAAQLYLSDKTIRNYVSNILAKLQVEDRAQAVVRARRAGLGEDGRPG